MPIEQIISALPAGPDPVNDSPKAFSEKAATYSLAQKAMVPQLNTLTQQINAAIEEINAIPGTGVALRADLVAPAGAGLVGYGTGTVADALTNVPVSGGPRDALLYRDSLSMTVCRRFVVMGGFRYRGQYTRGRAPMFPMPASTMATCGPAGLGAETTFCIHSWYAAFACANAGDAAATIKTMPYLRVMSVVGNVVNLNKGGEGIHTAQAQSYAWSAANNLAGTECLIISEGGGWSGRVATITANTTTSVTLNNVGSLAFGDYLLPAPPGKSYYAYLGSWYMDDDAVRNIYDTGLLIKSKMIGILKGNKLSDGSLVDYANGSFPAGSGSLMMNVAGYICPLATGVTVDSQCTLSTVATGDLAEYYDVDASAHIIHTSYLFKTNSGSLTYVFPNVQVPFLYHQKFNWSTGGTLQAERNGGALNITGWFEP
jgi:hypothetical protein